MEQVRFLVRDIAARYPKLDVLINNAGVFMNKRQLSADGFEMTFAVNHLAPFLLTCELLPLLRDSHARVITVSSMVHSNVHMDFDNLNTEKRFDGLQRVCSI